MKWDVGKLLECNTFCTLFIVIADMNCFCQYNTAESLQCAAYEILLWISWLELWSTKWSRFLAGNIFQKLTVAQVTKNFFAFFLQPLPFAGPYFELEDSGQHPHNKFIKDPLQYYSPIYDLVSQVAYSHEVCLCSCEVCVCVHVCVCVRSFLLFLPFRKVIRHNFAVNCEVYKLITSAETVCTCVFIM
jgi:hypothetical protein